MDVCTLKFGESNARLSRSQEHVGTYKSFQVIHLVTELILLIVSSEGRQLTPLVCNSVNDLQDLNVQTDLVYVTTRGRECTFVFEGPPGSQLDIKVHSFSSEGTAKANCKNPPVRLFTYNVKNKLRQYEKVLCAEDDAVRTVTDGNTAVITSAVRYGSFFVRVKAISSLIDPRIRDKNIRVSNSVVQQRRTDSIARRRNDLLRFTKDSKDQTDIDGMYPPNLQSVDFFAMLNQFEIPLRFRAQPQGFTPSFYYPSPGNPRPTDSYGVPVTSGPILWGIYPGSPGADISITSTQSPTEWIGSQPSISPGGGFTGYPESRPSTSKPETEKVTEATTEPVPTRHTEALTIPTTTAAPLSSAAALSSSEPPLPSTLSQSKAPHTVTASATATANNLTVSTGTNITSSEKQRMIISQIAKNSAGFKPMEI